MYSMQLASCVALTLVLLVNSAPTSSPAKETQQHLEQLLLDLQVLLRGIDVSAAPSVGIIFSFLAKGCVLITMCYAFSELQESETPHDAHV